MRFVALYLLAGLIWGLVNSRKVISTIIVMIFWPLGLTANILRILTPSSEFSGFVLRRMTWVNLEVSRLFGVKQEHEEECRCWKCEDYKGPLRIYVASSWRNELQQTVVKILREKGYDVYDYRNPAPGDMGFSWKSVAPSEEHLKNPKLFRDVVLESDRAKQGFGNDMNALCAADVCILVLPCGRSAHLELGHANGIGAITMVLLDDPMSEPELMYKMNTYICTSMEEVLKELEMADADAREAWLDS